MKTLPKPVIIAVIAIIVLSAGSLLLIRSCMFGKGGKGFGGAPAGMREQFASVPAIYIEKDGQAIILTIVSHLKIHSYSRKGNMIQKRASNTYYLQTNDARTAGMIAEVKLKAQSQIKSYPVEILGQSGTTAWIFMGEPMAYDAFTLEKKADMQILEEKNKTLAGKFPAERRYYTFDPGSGNIFFTARDGSKWELNTRTLLATAREYEGDNNLIEQQIETLEQAEKQNQADLDSLYQQKDRASSKKYAAGEISYTEYNRISKQYREERDVLMKKRDSLRLVKNNLREWERSGRELQRNLENLQEGQPDYSEIRVNQDTADGKWYGLYSPAEMKKLNRRLQYHSERDETARRQLYTSTYSETRPGIFELEQSAASPVTGQNSFLHAGFLVDKQTARPLHLPGLSFIVVHKEQIGRDASILLSRVSAAGKTAWTLNTKLAEWADWICTGNQVILLGTDHKDLSSGQVNVLLCIDLASGKASRYDYYENRIVGAE